MHVKTCTSSSDGFFGACCHNLCQGLSSGSAVVILCQASIASFLRRLTGDHLLACRSGAKQCLQVERHGRGELPNLNTKVGTGQKNA